jgi:hypothetical protein
METAQHVPLRNRFAIHKPVWISRRFRGKTDTFLSSLTLYPRTAFLSARVVNRQSPNHPVPERLWYKPTTRTVIPELSADKARKSACLLPRF